jgi:hypothetical protein
MKKIFTAILFATTCVINTQAQVTRKVLIEEFTGTWCPNCPDGHTILKGIETSYPGRTVVVGMHNADAYNIPYETAMENAFAVAAFPRAAIDRVIYSGGNANVMSRSYWDGAVAARLNVTSPVEIKISPSLEASTRTVTVKIDYTFKADVSEETRLTCVLLEDSILASQAGATGTYTHMDVCRALLSADNWGDANHPATVTNGQAFSKTYTYVVPAAINLNNMRVVALINKKIGTTPVYDAGTAILNAEEAKVYNAPLSISETNKTNAKTNCYPNPFTDITALDFTLQNDGNINAFVTDVNGTIIYQFFNEKRSAGNHTIYWGGTSNDNTAVANGLYFINVISAEGKISSPVILKR